MNKQEMNELSLSQEKTLLAAERTFSAWLRTAIAAMAGGLAVLRLISFKTDMHRIVAHIMGETLILWGVAVIIISSMDYKTLQDKLTFAKNYKSSSMGFFMIVIPLLIISALLVWVTLP